MKQHDSVNIYGFNSPEWLISNMAAILAGGKCAGIYPTDTAEQVQYKCDHSGGAVMCVEESKHVNIVKSCADQLPYLKAVVVWAAKPDVKSITRKDGSKIAVYAWEEFLALGDAVEEKELEARIAAQRPGHCCCLIYTSGTTGNPKAVMLSHDSITFEAKIIVESMPVFKDATGERVVSYLPLSHIAGLTTDVMAGVFSCADTDSWLEVSFARPYDLKLGSIGERLRAVKPTYFLGVPRVWEKIAEKMKAVGAATTGLKKSIATWAKAKGLEYARNCQLGGSGAVPFNYGAANKIVLSKVKMALGLDQCKVGVTGAAPIAIETLEYFGQLGIQINEVYGMSECCGATTFSSDEAHVWGSCGWQMDGCEVRVFQVDPANINKKKQVGACKDIFNCPEELQGELCYRGRHIMMGYMAQPRFGKAHMEEMAKKNRDAIDDEGWLHSGDKGCVSTTGMFRITGRYKELIIGAGGENIAPVPIEDAIKKMGPAISNVMMVGDKRKFNVCLVTLKAVGATGEFPGGDDLLPAAIAEVKTATTKISQACTDPEWIKYIDNVIAKVNKTVPNNASVIGKFSILPADFSSETGELTPTLKLKRSVVEKKWAKLLDAIYESKDNYCPCTAKTPPAAI